MADALATTRAPTAPPITSCMPLLAPPRFPKCLERPQAPAPARIEARHAHKAIWPPQFNRAWMRALKLSPLEVGVTVTGSAQAGAAITADVSSAAAPAAVSRVARRGGEPAPRAVWEVDVHRSLRRNS